MHKLKYLQSVDKFNQELIPYVYIIVSLIFIFSIIRTLDYPHYLLKSQQVRIIEVQLYG